MKNELDVILDKLADVTAELFAKDAPDDPEYLKLRDNIDNILNNELEGA